MKKMSFLFLVIIAFCPAINSQNTTKEQKIVNQTITDLFQGFSELDMNKIGICCTSDFLLFENGLLWNLDSLAIRINGRKNVKDFNRVNKFDFIKTEFRENTAWTSYYNQAEISAGGKRYKVRWLESAILVKDGKKWKIKFLHSTELERSN